MKKLQTQQLRWWIACACLLLPAALSLAAETEAARTTVQQLLGAVQAQDYDAFVAQGTPEFKAGITRQMPEGVSAQLSERMKQGYDLTYLGDLRQQGHDVHLWRLRFKDGGDDTLARLSIKDGKVSGFWLQ